MPNLETFRARFRFRVSKKLNIPTAKHQFTIAGREVVLSAVVDEIPIRDSDWLVMNARGFASEQDAIEFGHKLRTAVDVSSVATRLGLDSGVDRPTSGVGQLVREHVAREHGTLLRDNVHGLDVFPDDPNVRIFSLSATGTVRKEADPFLENLASLVESADRLSNRGKDVVLLLNYALMRTDPVSQIVFALSAVEMLGQQEAWSEAQERLISDLASDAEKRSACTREERREIADAIRKRLHKISLRQGVMRLLTSLGLEALKKEWDHVYGQRSTLVHGLAPKPGADYDQLAFRTMSLCGRILLRVIAQDVPLADQHVDRFYERQV